MSTATVPASTAGVQAIYTKHIFPRRSEAAQRRMEGHVLALLAEFGYPPSRLKGLRVLDAGCGTGEVACVLAQQGAHVTALDCSSESLAYARDRARRLGFSVDFQQGWLESHPLPPASFDLVLSHMVLHHTADPGRIVRHLAGALAPGGAFIFKVFTFWGCLSPMQPTPLWKLWIVRGLARTPAARMALARRLFYRPGQEAYFGVTPETYLADAYAVPIIDQPTYRELRRWCAGAGLSVEAMNPPETFRAFVAALGPARPGQRLKTAVQRLAQTRVGRWRWPAEVALAACRGANMTSVLARKPVTRDVV